MTDAAKIKMIYVGVAVISVAILGMSWFLTTLKKERREDTPPMVDQGKEEVDELTVLEKDIELVRQDGTPFKISQLNDKVWLAVQFYVTCPMCAERNAEQLVKIYREFEDEPDFRVVCLSVDPDDDTEEKIQEVRSLLDVDTENWLFLKTDRQELWDYMRNEMLFADIRERKEPAEIAAKGKWAHDLGIQVYRGNVLVKHWRDGLDLDSLRLEVDRALNDIKK